MDTCVLALAVELLAVLLTYPAVLARVWVAAVRHVAAVNNHVRLVLGPGLAKPQYFNILVG